MRHIIQAFILSGLITFPAFAKGEGMAPAMTCGEFLAKNSAGQMMAVEDMYIPAKEMMSDKMMAEDNMAAEDSMMAGDSMAMENSMMAEDSMAAEDSMMAKEMVVAVRQACQGHPDQMVMDVMMMVHQ